MTQVISFSGYTPAIRYDTIPWTDVQIEETDEEEGTYTIIDTIALSPVDPDPSDPAARSFTTSLASDDPDLWYRVRFLDAGSNTSQPTVPVQNTAVTLPEATPYAEVEELARLVNVRTPNAAQTAAMERVLAVAASEINSEVGLPTGYEIPYPALVVEVNLERAVEHWQQMESPFGILGLGGDVIPAHVARDSWDRHAHKLAPLKLSWGLA